MTRIIFVERTSCLICLNWISKWNWCGLVGHGAEVEGEPMSTSHMSLHSGSVFSRLSKHSGISGSSPLALHLGNDNAMRKLLRDGVGIKELQKKYLSLCYGSRPPVRPNKEVVQRLGKGELVWNLTACEKRDTDVIAALLSSNEACAELKSVVFSAGETGCPSIRKRSGTAARPAGRKATVLAGSKASALERDPAGQVELFNVLCKSLPSLRVLTSLELEGLRKAFEKSGAGAVRLARGLKGNTTLKSFTVRNVRLAEPRVAGSLSAAIATHPALVAISLRHCGLVGEPGGRLVSSVIKAHAARRENMVWSAGLRKPEGFVGNTAADAPNEIARAGCLAVDLEGNRLGDAGVHAVARSLQSDTWLVGLNLSDNGVTDRGAAILSMCLQRNTTLCALVLDRNPAIRTEAERRITAELATRSTLPSAIMEEQEAVVMLAMWGYRAHDSCEDDCAETEPSAPRPGGSMSAVSAISDEISLSVDGFHPDSVVTAKRFGNTSAGTETNATHRQHLTTCERKEEMVREFTRHAGYKPTHLPNSASPPGATIASLQDINNDDEEDIRRRASAGTQPSRLNFSGTPAMAPTTARRVDAARFEVRDLRHEVRSTRTSTIHSRSRSLSSRSSPPTNRSTNSSSRVAKRSRSSGPNPTRTFPAGRSDHRMDATCGSRRVVDKTPWGAAPRVVGGARERAQAWARTELKKVNSINYNSCRGHRRSGNIGRSTIVVNSNGGGSGRMNTHRSRVRRGPELGRRPRKQSSGGRNSGAVGRGRTRRRAPAEGAMRPRQDDEAGHWVNRSKVGGRGNILTSRMQARMYEVGAQAEGKEDRLEHGREYYPELNSRRERTGLDGDVVEAAMGGLEGRRDGVGDDGEKTNRVVSMLAALEKVVMTICEDMWKLEDRIQGADDLESPCTFHNEDSNEHPVTLRTIHRDALPNKYVDASAPKGDDGSSEVAAQVAARLREMWHIPASNTNGNEEPTRPEGQDNEGAAGGSTSRGSPRRESGWEALRDLIERESGEAAVDTRAGNHVYLAGEEKEGQARASARGRDRNEEVTSDYHKSANVDREGWNSPRDEVSSDRQQQKDERSQSHRRREDEDAENVVSRSLMGMENDVPFTVAVPLGVAIESPPSRVYLAVDEDEEDELAELGVELDHDVSYSILSA